MTINYIVHSIENSLKNSFYGISYDAIFTTLTTIFVFVVGILANIYINHRKEISRLSHIENYFLKVLSKFLEPVEKQVKAFSEISKAIRDIKSRNYSLNINSDLLFDPLINTDKLDLFKIFVYSKKGKNDAIKIVHYSNIVGSIEFIKNQIELAKVNFDKFFSDIRRYEKQWNGSLNEILRKWDIYLSFNKRNGIGPSDDPFLKEFDIQLQKLKDEEIKSTIITVKSEFLDPLKKICVENSKDPRAIELLSIITSSNEAYKNILAVKDFYAKAFSEDSEALNERIKLMSDAINYYKTT